jgi:hypothetical protein
MSTLSKEFRRQLENTVLKARDEAERGAAAALEELGLSETKIPTHLNEAQQKLRRKLRAHGKQVGDTQISDNAWDISHLVHECAYAHWHRMLFARFLAENGFLIEPESGLDVDFAYCEEEAKRLGIDPWELASQFAQGMLTGVFRADDPVLQVRMPTEFRNRLTALLASLPREVFTASDSLGWVYQFWQAKKKDEVNAAGNKIGADELPSVTQLFTEDYMVDFLLDNTLGAWWAGKKAKDEGRRMNYETEAEARAAVALPGCEWKYLRFVKVSPDGKALSSFIIPPSSFLWTPAAGTFDGWPMIAAALKCLDPCMGSGHFVVAMFQRLVALRMAEENLSEADAVAAVIRDNLFGLEIDPRCTQIAAFNLALAAWRRVGHCKLPAMNLACSGLAPNTSKDSWVNLAALLTDDSPLAGERDLLGPRGEPMLLDARLAAGMARLYDLFQKAPVLGSLINPRSGEADLLVAAFHELQPLLEKALAQETKDDTAHELAVTARGLAKAAEILAGQFTLVATNPPFLGLEQQVEVLEQYVKLNHSEARRELALCFLQRCYAFLPLFGCLAFVLPGEWTFVRSNREFRKHLLTTASLRALARLGLNAFVSKIRVTPVLLISSPAGHTERNATMCLDVSAQTLEEKPCALLRDECTLVSQEDWRNETDCRLLVHAEPRLVTSGTVQIESIADSRNGLSAGDGVRFESNFWEVQKLGGVWEPLQSSAAATMEFGGRERIVRWEDEAGEMAELAESVKHLNHAAQNWRRGKPLWGRSGVVVNQIGAHTTIYTGDKYDGSCFAIVPNDKKDTPALVAFALQGELKATLKRINPTWNLKSPKTLLQMTLDLAHWQKVAAEKYPHGLPRPFSNDPTQWLFNGHPAGADQPLHVAVARLLGYQWPRQTGSSFPDCPALGPDGLEKHADKDGVVCFSQVRNEPPAADRLRALLADAYGKEWSHALERKLIAATGSKADSLEDWLLNDFFAQHGALFHNRPFIWHIWDGRKDGFNVLVNYHKLAGPNGEGHRTLETLTHAYLGDWIGRQRNAVKHEEAGAEDRLAAALELQGELKKIVAGEPPYDLFIRWKALADQPIGWNPDLNDGVRLNIRPFLAVDLSRGKKGCGVLRSKLNVKWEKNKGTEPSRPKEDFPWFWKWDQQTVDFTGNGEFDGNRWNDCHYTTAFKRAAQERKK